MDSNNIPMNNEGMAFLGMAYASARLANSSIQMPVADMADVVVTAIFPRTYQGEVALAGGADVVDTNPDHVTTFLVNEFIRGDHHENGRYPTYLFGRRTENELGDYTHANADNCPDSDAKKLIVTVVGGTNDWMQWLIDLINAYQTGGLTAGNVSSYFAWCGMDNVDGNYIASNICSLSGGITKIAETEEGRGLLRTGKWTDYRLNFATVVGQLDKMISEVPADYMQILSSRTKTAIENAKLNNWSEDAFRDIGTKPLAVLQAWLIASDQKIKNLWSAQRAYDELSVSEKKSLHNWFKKALSEIKVYEGGRMSSYNDMPQSLKDI